jgi:hypothetical protein
MARWTYNKCLIAIRDMKRKISKKELKVYCLNKEAFGREVSKSFKWALDMLYEIRGEAMNNLLKDYQSNIAKRGQYKIHFRSKKDKQQCITILNK